MFATKAAKIEIGSFGGVEVWQGISSRDLQHGKSSSRVVTIDDENGIPCCSMLELAPHIAT